MNLTTIGNIPSSNWKRIKGQYLAVAAGVVFAAGAAVSLAGSGSSSQPVAPSRQAVIPAPIVSIESIEGYAAREQAAVQALSARPAVSALDAAIAASVLSAEMAHYGAPAEAVRSVSEADALSSARSGEASVYGAEPAVAEQRRVSDADILASALSGEAATYDFAEPAQTPGDPSMVEAAIAASVLSTELAAWAP